MTAINNPPAKRREGGKAMVVKRRNDARNELRARASAQNAIPAKGVVFR